MVQGQLKSQLSAVLQIRQHQLMSDVASNLGGQDLAPNPHELLEASLAACTIITVQMYAKRKNWNLQKTLAEVRITQEGPQSTLQRKVEFVGELSVEQRQRLLEIANKCPIHRLLTSEVHIETEMNENLGGSP